LLWNCHQALSGDTAVYRATSDQGVDLAAMLDDLLADKDEEGASG
jgi:hypothetical protein